MTLIKEELKKLSKFNNQDVKDMSKILLALNRTIPLFKKIGNTSDIEELVRIESQKLSRYKDICSDKMYDKDIALHNSLIATYPELQDAEDTCIEYGSSCVIDVLESITHTALECDFCYVDSYISQIRSIEHDCSHKLWYTIETIDMQFDLNTKYITFRTNSTYANLLDLLSYMNKYLNHIKMLYLGDEDIDILISQIKTNIL